MNLKGKVCLVVGASSGMGRETARKLARGGAEVILAARRLPLCEEVVSEIVATGGQASALQVDGTQDDSVAALLASIEDRFGRLDGVFNNLGHTFGHSPFHETPTARWADTLETNLTAVFRLLRAQVPLLLKSGGGSIVNNSSTGGLTGVRAMADYSAAKWGVIGLTRSVAVEYADQNIRCNVIAPGIIQTKKFVAIRDANPELFEQLLTEIPARKFGDMADIADAVSFLLSDQSHYVNGVTLPVDGGRTA
jgi:NAD(P)-dependent dehydrogenase (short-subunit alcohol dehydrogenase family)